MTPGKGSRALALEVGAVVAVSVAIAAAADRLALMSALVPAVFALRLALWTRLAPEERGHGLGAELALLAICTALGAFNDWNSVVRRGVYDYTVPADLPALSTIPSWMLLFWGLVLRALAALARRLGVGDSERAERGVRLGAREVGGAAARAAVMLALVLATRQGIYRFHAAPVLSWAPFAAALALYALLLRPGRPELRLMGAIAVLGPAIEVLYIQVGGLHRYHLGWLGGVPLWIALWWVLAAPIWGELSGRLERALARRFPAVERFAPSARAVRRGSVR